MASVTDIIGGSITDGVAKIISLFKVDPNLALQHQTELEKIRLEQPPQTSAPKQAPATSTRVVLARPSFT
jgi:hypothetical protein